MSYTTYIVRDPRDDAPIYVGQSANFEKRKKSHVSAASRKLPNIRTLNVKFYLGKLYRLGFTPSFSVVDNSETEEASLASETRWVQEITAQGYPLLNRTRIHRAIVKSKFSSDFLKSYFSKRLEQVEL